MRQSRLATIFAKLRTGRIEISQIKIAASFGDPDAISVMAQMNIDFSPINPNDICKGIEECGIKVVLISYMVLRKIQQQRVTGWRLESSKNLFEEAKLWLKSPSIANQQSTILKDEIEFTAGGDFRLIKDSDLLSESIEVLKLTYEEIPESAFFKYIASVVVPYILGEVTLEEIHWPPYPEKAPILKLWDWIKEKFH